MGSMPLNSTVATMASPPKVMLMSMDVPGLGKRDHITGELIIRHFYGESTKDWSGY